MRVQHGRIVVIVLALVIVAVGCNGGWASPRSGVDQSGFNPDESVIGLGNVASLTPRFAADLGAAPSMSPVFDGDGHFFVSTANEVQGRDAVTGAPLWRSAPF